MHHGGQGNLRTRYREIIKECTMRVIFNELLMLQQVNTSLSCSKGYRANDANVVRRPGYEHGGDLASVNRGNSKDMNSILILTEDQLRVRDQTAPAGTLRRQPCY